MIIPIVISDCSSFISRYPYKLAETFKAHREILQKYSESGHPDKIPGNFNTFESKQKILILVDYTDKDNSDWEEAKKINTTSAYDKYLKSHKNGKHVNEAKKRIESLEKDEKNQKIPKWYKSEEYKKLISKFPRNFLSSVIIVREGVLDFGKTTIKEFFFSKPFKTSITQNLSGNKIKITSRISGVKVHGSLLSFDITILGDEQPDTKFTLNFRYLSEYKESLLDSVSVKNYETNKSYLFSDIGSKLQILSMISKLY